MFYKKNALILSLCYYFLFLSSNCHQVPIASISNDKDRGKEHALEDKKPLLSLSSCRTLGSISCMSGAKTDFLIECKGTISNIDLPLKGQLAFIGLVDGAELPTKASIVKSAIDAKGQADALLWQDQDGFIYWPKPDSCTKKWMLKIQEQDYKKLSSKKYAVHILYLPNGASEQGCIISTIPVPMDTKGTDDRLPNYQNIGLEAMAPIEQQTSSGIDWFLKGKIQDAYPKDGIKVGFILAKERTNPYTFIQRLMAAEGRWPTLPTAFNDEVIVIPGTFRKMDPPIVATLPSSQRPIQGGQFKLICYAIQGQHYYLSQMEHIVSNGRIDSLSKESVPPSIHFTGERHSVKVSNIDLSRAQVPGGESKVILSDFKIEYFVKDQVTPLPADLKASLLFLQKGTIWRTAAIESLFKKLDGSNRNAGIAEDGTICLVTDSRKPLDKSCINFFTHGADYEYFTCLFSSANHKLTFYTEKEQISIREAKKEQPAPKYAVQSSQPIDITLDNKGAYITFKIASWWNPFSAFPVYYSLPKVTLAPIQLDKKELKHRGFVITKEEKPDGVEMHANASLIDTIDTFIKNNRSISYEANFLIFKEELAKDMTEQLGNIIYNTYQNEKKGQQTLFISYWAKYENKIVWSNPVSIQLTIDQ